MLFLNANLALPSGLLICFFLALVVVALVFLQLHRGPAVVGRHGSMMVRDGSYGHLVPGMVGQVRSCGMVHQ